MITKQSQGSGSRIRFPMSSRNLRQAGRRLTENDKAVTWLIRIFSIALLFGMIVWTVTKTGVIALIGTENVYWERARFLLGEGGATIYTGSSVCSLGYSLILLPICVLIKSPYAAYKAAVLLNGLFLIGAYLTATAAAGKLFPKEGKAFLSAACFFAVFTPALMIDKTYTGPEMAVLFLMWISIYFLASLWEEARSYKAAALAACMILIAFLQITALGVILAVTVLLGFYVRRKRLSETAFLGFVLAVLIGIAAGNIGERAFLYAFARDLDLTSITSSLEVLLKGILTFAETGWFSGFCATFAGKLYSVLIATFLLACPAFWQLGSSFFSKKKKTASASLPVLGISGIFVIQFFWMCLYDNSLGISKGMLSLSGLELVLPPLMLVGIVQIRRLKSWYGQLPAYLLLLCVCTFSAAASMQAQKTAGVSASSTTNAGNGFLMIFQGLSRASDPGVLYLASCVVLLVAVVLAFLFLGYKKRYDRLQKICGTAIAFVVFFVINILSASVTVQAMTEQKFDTIAPIASLLSGTDTQSTCVYLSTSDYDSTIPVLQSLMPETDLTVINNKEEERADFYRAIEQGSEPENLLILTESSQDKIENTYQEELSGYRLIYMTKNLALWVPKESALETELEKGVEERMELLPLAQTEKIETTEETEESEGEEEWEEIIEMETEELSEQEEIIQKTTASAYSGDQPLAAGTYRFYLSLTTKTNAPGSVAVTVTDSSGTLFSSTFDEQIFDESGHGIFSAEFTSRDPMWEVEISAEGSLLENAKIEQVFYCKTSSAYTVDLNDTTGLSDAASVILSLDEGIGTAGSVAYVDALAEDAGEVSLRSFEDCLPGYELTAVTEEELPELNTDYLVAATKNYTFYPAMDQYSIISLDSVYTVLVRNDSVQYETFTAKNGPALSEGTQIDIRAFSQGERKASARIYLGKGDYLYHVTLRYDTKNILGKNADTAGIVRISDGGTILAEQEVTYADLRSSSGELTVELPLVLRSSADRVRCSFENQSSVKFHSDSVRIELLSQKYQYGKEEPELGTLLEEINTLGEGAKVTVIQSEETIQNKSVGYAWLQEQLPLCELEELSAKDARNETEDRLLLTYGLNKDNIKLLKKYSILCHAGGYTLWAKNNGAFLSQLLSEGAAILNDGTKLTPESLAAMTGQDYEDGIIPSLPRGSYTFYVRLTAKDLDPEDTLELNLYRDKKKKEIREEVDELAEEGYTEEEALELIEPQIRCGSASYAAWKFGDSDNRIVQISKYGSGAAQNLYCDVVSWQQEEVEAEIVWVEVN